MRKLVILGVVLAASGCGGDRSELLPAACTQGPGAVTKALVKAPGAVTIDGTPISKCFNRDASGDDIQILGTNLLGSAQPLGDQARAGDQTAALRLGYLIGAAERGAKRSGLGAEIVRRLEAEATVARAQRTAYDRGLRAGSVGG